MERDARRTKREVLAGTKSYMKPIRKYKKTYEAQPDRNAEDSQQSPSV